MAIGDRNKKGKAKDAVIHSISDNINIHLKKKITMKAKLIEYAYPTSTTATNAGYGKTGCWFISLYPSVDACFGEEKTGDYFLEKHDAIAKAESMPEPYNHMHKYFNV